MNTDRTAKRVVMITGGHVTPAIAAIDEMRVRYPSWQIVFVGRKVAIEGERVLSEEYHLVTKMGLTFLPLVAGKLKREGGIGAAISLAKIPIGFVQSLWYVWRERPDIIVSFGGYVALPVVIAGWIVRVPVVTHEQTRVPGLANRIIARMAVRTCISFPDSQNARGLSGELIYTGLPIRSSVFHPPKTTSFPLPQEGKPLMLVVGGSTGAKSINSVVYDALPRLLDTWTVIHQVGRISQGTALRVKASLARRKESYIPVPYLSETDYSWAMNHADIVIGRSGANTVTELAAAGKVALFIPLPWSAGNEQYHNARFLEEAGSARILTQDRLSAASLLKAIHLLMHNKNERNRIAKNIAQEIPRDGAARLVDAIFGVMG